MQGDAAQAQLVIDRHRQALEFFLRVPAESLTLQHVQIAHSVLMGSTEPSQLRRSTAYAGQVEFSRASELPDLMQRFMDRLLNHILPRQDLSQFAKAAWASYHVNAIHPFSDGNGRLSRIFINWILHGAPPHDQRLPFTIVLCRNGAQRAAYIESLRQALATGHVSGLAEVIANTTMRAWRAFHRTRERIERAHVDSDTTRIIRVNRERSRNSDTCSICMETLPNMSVLCCGGVFHINCLMRWFQRGGNGSCPNCRESIHGQEPQAAVAAPADPLPAAAASAESIDVEHPLLSQSVQEAIAGQLQRLYAAMQDFGYVVIASTFVLNFDQII